MQKGRPGKNRNIKPGVKAEITVKQQWALLLIILAITFIVFSPALKDGFTNWDDNLYVTDNTLIKSISFDNLRKFGDNVAGNFHPLTMISLAVNYYFHKLDPFYYHLTNILFHLLNTVLVFFLVKKISRKNIFITFFTTLFFAIHPMHVESVAWVSERKDVLYSFFFLAGLLLYYLYIEKRKGLLLLAVFLLFVLSDLSKSAAVVFPVLLLLIDYYEGRKLNTKVLLEKLPFLLIAVWIGIIAIHTQSQSNAIGDFKYYSLLERIRIAAYGLITYIIKFVVPFRLSSFHPYPKGGFPAYYNLSLIAVLALIVYFIYKGRKQKWLLFGFGFYLITVALVLQFLTVGNAVIAERYTYLPYIGLGVIYFEFCSRILHKLASSNTKYLVWALLSIQIISFVGVSYARTRVWKNSETLWTDVLKKYPDTSGAYTNRGHYYRTNHDYQKAIENYNKAIELDKHNYLAFHNRGKAYFDLGKYDEALNDMNEAIRLKPDFAETYSNRGSIFAIRKDYTAAIKDFDKAIQLDPKNANAYANRSLAYFYSGKNEKALEDADAFLRINPNDPDMLNVRGLCYNKLDKNQEALADFNRSIMLNPKQGVFYQNRSFLYSKMGDKQNALKDILHAQQLGVKVDDNYLSGLRN